MCLDTGYDYQEVRDIVEEFGCTAPIRSRGEEAQAMKEQAGQKARRWVVERSRSWMNRFRRILVRWDKKPEHYLAFLHFATALIAFRAAGVIRIGTKQLPLNFGVKRYGAACPSALGSAPWGCPPMMANSPEVNFSSGFRFTLLCNPLTVAHVLGFPTGHGG